MKVKNGQDFTEIDKDYTIVGYPSNRREPY